MFKIGEFSKIAQVPGSLLRYYDRIDLLKPAVVDDFTGYRYYSAHQLPRLHRILALKELGLSLEQIRRMVDGDVSADEIRGMLALRKAQIEQSLQEEAMRLLHVESRLQQMELEDSPIVDVVVKAVPERPFLSLRLTLPALEAGFDIMGEMAQTLPARVDDALLGYFTAVIHSDTLEDDQVDVEMGYQLHRTADLTITLPSERQMQVRTLPGAETMATVIRNGGFENNYQSYGAIGLWMEDNGYQIAGPGREVLIAPPRGGNIVEMVTEIQFPVMSVQPDLFVPPD
ncbi:MAG: MerR family transcriptional regulator [Ardenticatenaceae bacterium]|nr:MerR family transcriptional regulator [Anaerolineales bacterium]MCB8921532.1 MerR family transcriptional regulator [Ardenticatenaceae bacterium]MCB8990938.1 MerR family transcriptional regulator [Ardenticatenaceae bacterium]MCB9004411.1 MerR family transcriptional regulator [Ardenticatenaceae bacterium]